MGLLRCTPDDDTQFLTVCISSISNIFFYSSRMKKKKRVIVTEARARNGNIIWQRGEETVLREKWTITTMNCRAFACQKWKHLLKQN